MNLKITANNTIKLPLANKHIKEDVNIIVDVPTPEGYIKPEGTLEIESNGEADVTNYEKVNVNIPIPEGYIKPEGELEITENGTKDVTNYESVNVNVPTGLPKEFIEGTMVNLTIPAGTTKIGPGTFAYYFKVTEINIPKTVTEIGIYAFSSSYIEIVFEESESSSLTTIGDYAFSNSHISSISLPNSVTSVGKNLFNGCSSLANVSLPNSLTTISDYMFYNCFKLSNIILPESITKIGNNAFANVPLENITFPSNLTSIGSNAFYNNSKITSIRITHNVTNIGSNAFNKCSNLVSIWADTLDSVPTLGTNAFDNLHSSFRIYVSNELVDEFKAATNWSKYADKIVGR